MMGYAVPRIAEWNPRSALGPSTFEQTVRRRFRPLLAGSLAKVFGSKRRVDVNNPKRPKRIQHGVASPAAFDEAVHTSFITGAALNVDGGCPAWFRASLSPLVWRFLLVKPDRWDQI
jgi:hypothetical protein